MAEYKLPTTGNCDVLIHLVREFDLTVEACLDGNSSEASYSGMSNMSERVHER